jgi:hypothetical protein
VAAVGVLAGSAMPASAATGWVVQTTANPAGGVLNELDAVSCASAANCMAVGNQQSSAGASTVLAEHWNGSTWALSAALNPSGDTGLFLTGVSCPSATYCVAVGVNQPSVSASTAVAESWNGSTWTLQSPVSPTKAWLSAVSCTATNNCEAVGSDSAGPLAEHWNGSTWAAQTVPAAAGGLNAVSCVSASFCKATNAGALAATWNGSTWTTQATQPGTLFSISCATTTSCEVVGYLLVGQTASTVVEHWNGSTWAYQTVDGADTLWGVSCASATSCIAVGTQQNPNGSGRQLTAADIWNGSTWTHQSTPNPSGAGDADFQAVSCPTTADCTGVGDWFVSSPSLARTLGEQWTS